MLLGLYSCNHQKSYALTTFQLQNNEGWGYSISVNGKPFIRQERIPCVTGNKRFVSQKDAQKVGKRVVQKLKKGESPTINKEDLSKLKIIDDPILKE